MRFGFISNVRNDQDLGSTSKEVLIVLEIIEIFFGI